MNDPITISLDHADEAYVERLISAVHELGGKVVDTQSGVAGSVEMIIVDFELNGAAVRFNYDNYESGSLEGPAEAIEAIQQRLTQP